MTSRPASSALLLSSARRDYLNREESVSFRLASACRAREIADFIDCLRVDGVKALVSKAPALVTMLGWDSRAQVGRALLALADKAEEKGYHKLVDIYDAAGVAWIKCSQQHDKSLRFAREAA